VQTGQKTYQIKMSELHINAFPKKEWDFGFEPASSSRVR